MHAGVGAHVYMYEYMCSVMHYVYYGLCMQVWVRMCTCIPNP